MFDYQRLLDRGSLLLTLAWLSIGTMAPLLVADDETAETSNVDFRATPEQLEFFEKEVRPLLIKHCYECHSVDADRLEAGLTLDSRAAMIHGGDSGAAVIPGDADQSLLIEAVRFESYEMPPKGQLPDHEIEVLTRWVNLGAPWPDEAGPTAKVQREAFDLEERRSDFWVWQPIEVTDPPMVNDSDWPITDADHYILSKLEAAGLKPAADADRSALLRRLAFDLTGLPPTPDQVKAFLADQSPGAYERVVDQMLASDHFGERWARHWMDSVRYAESRGHEFDNDIPNAFQYRDYLIRAFNADVPYDQLVREHLAGDLLPDPRLHPETGANESVLGTGFWYLGEWVHSPVDVRKDEADRFDNMIDVMSKTFLGVTVACARCHDHKFDAISTADYYSLSGFLQSSDYRQVRFESMEQNGEVAERLAKVDERYRRQLMDVLAEHDLRPPSTADVFEHPAILVDYADIQRWEFLQDGYLYGDQPRRAGTPSIKQMEGKAKGTSVAEPEIEVSIFSAAVNDSIWSGLESVSEGGVKNMSAVAKLPKSGRTLRTPTFELEHGKVHCRVDGAGWVVACVDSHRLVAGPLHGETIRPIKPGQRWVKLDLDRYVGHRLHLEFVPEQDASLSVRLVTQGLDKAGIDELDRKLSEYDAPMKAFADAAEAILNQRVKFESRVFSDFESGTYEGWTVEGDAFGTTPQTLETIAKYQGRINGKGVYFVNSHDIRPGGDIRRGDELTGTLTSEDFTIDFDEIEFLIGGGAYPGETCVNLLIDGKVVLSATGDNRNQMSLRRWDVRAFRGNSARLQVVDRHTGGWGNVGLDQIVFKTAIEQAEGDPVARQIIKEWDLARRQLAKQIVRRSRVAPAMLDGTGEDDRILIRGNASKPGDLEPRHFLTALSGDEPMKIKVGSGRLELAQAINDPTNPLTSRVIVNRVWHQLMGRGIVSTVDDFGVLGQRPTHPALLDHLATKFADDGQSLKSIIKSIVLSRTYRMSSLADPQAVAADPNNLLWHHRPPQRLEGEAIRDSLLAISGQLNVRMYGPPVPIHLTSFMDGRGRPGKSGPMDGDGRRSIYTAVRRNFLSPFMLAFDTPVPFSSMGRRNVSNVPAQALIMMNNPLVVSLAAKWGDRALNEVPEIGTEAAGERIEWMYLSAFGRQPTQQETQTALAYLMSQANEHGCAAENPELWAKLAHVIVNTKEFIFLR
ncbi:PSD1 and planctomycete cytochrome C domain-containing protein [Roseiconus lacunae]|uniref:PSD1 and planctomycete cytochrome C domain-containing protein n=1 Tax=Roseiconus lacunae TaxID=2605694 RepID=UPI001F2376D4|nr:PSD1 and planctomycete cytochrome C domain-containing protein [Roseiconus lacunae]